MKAITWKKKIPFFKNTYVLRSLLLVYLIVISIMSIFFVVLFGMEGDWNQLGAFFPPMLGVYVLIFALFLFSSWVVLGNKYALKYTIDGDGFLIEGANDKSGNIKKIAIIAGALTGNPGVVGAGMLVKENVIFIPWEKIENLKVDKEKDRLVLKSSFWTQVAVHYPPYLAEDVIELVNLNLHNRQEYV